MKSVLFGLFFLCAQLEAAEPNPPMTRIEYRAISPKILPNTFNSEPKVLYIAGPTYSRLEERPDPAEGMHGLIICALPDAWMINLLSRTARHIIDPGPTFVVHHNILDQKAPKEFSSFEFGKEVEFFRSRKATPLKPQSIDGQPCEASEFQYEDHNIALFVREDAGTPFHLDVFRDGKALFSIRYLSYQTDIPFNPSLFQPPKDVEIIEAGPNDTK